MGDLSAHFDSTEFRDRRTGETHPIDAALIVVLEHIRSAIGRPLPIVSGYRTEAHQRAVSTAGHSMHPLGKAADVPSGLVTIPQAVAAGASGIGYCRGWVVHLDTRPLAPGARPVIFRDCPGDYRPK